MSNNLNTRTILGGFPRSGSTLLQELLSEHFKEVFSPPEIPLFPLNYHQIRLNYKYLQKRLKSIYGLTKSEVKDAVLSSQNQIELMDKFAILVGKKLDIPFCGWINKYPTNIYSFEALREYDSSLKFWIHLRNPIDVLLSKVPSIQASNQYYCSLERFKSDARKIISLGKENFLITKYEDLVANPLMTLRTAAAFIGLELHEKVKVIRKLTSPSPFNVKFDYRIASDIVRPQTKVNSSSDKAYVNSLLKDEEFVDLMNQLEYEPRM